MTPPGEPVPFLVPDAILTPMSSLERLRWPSLLASLCIASFAVGSLLSKAALAAGDEPPKRPGSKPGDGFRFTPPGSPAKSADPGKAAPTRVPAMPEPPKDPIDVAIAALSTWPGQDGIKAAETLLLAGPQSVEPLKHALSNKDAPAIHPGAAWVLGHTGTASDVPLILRAAAERTSGSRLEVFFEAAQDLDVAITKKWLFDFLTLKRPVFRARASEFLAGLVTPEDRPKIDRLLQSREPGVRIAGYELLAHLTVPDVQDRLIDALPDQNPEVAKRAGQLLAFQGDEAVLPRLNALVREGDSRQRAYAVLALVEFSRRSRKSVFEPATLPELVGRRGLLHPDALPRGAAAVGLAYGALDSREKAINDLLDQPVIDILIDTVRGDHFLDYGSLVEPVFAALRRLSGLDLSSTAGPWEQWWAENRGRFRARRTLLAVSPEDMLHARVVFDVVDAEGRRRHAAFIPEGGDPVREAYVLPRVPFEALVGGLEDAGIFVQSDDSRTLADQHLAVKLGVMNQERRMVLLPSAEDPRYGTLSARLVAIEEQNLWQRYRDVNEFPNAVAWWKETTERFAAASPEVRRSTLVHMIVSSFAGLDGDAARTEALDLLDSLHADLSDAEAQHLLEVATGARAVGPVEARVVEMVAALDRPALAESLVEALAASPSVAASRLLAKTLSDAGPLRIKDAYTDTRPGVRAAAATATSLLLAGPAGRDETARKRLMDMLSEGLKSLLLDPDPLVKVRAAGALAQLGEPEMLAKLQDLYRGGDTSLRVAVAEALGRIGGSEIHPLLVGIVGEKGPENAPVRAAALEAMARSPDPDSIRILAYYMQEDADPSVQQAAESALTTIASDDARFALIDLLNTGTLEGERRVRVVRTLGAFDGAIVRETLGRYLEHTDVHVVDQAALGLARQNESVAVPYLIATLRRAEEPLRPKALAALQDLTCLTLLVTGYEAAADQYAAWYRTHRDGGDRAWFRDALKRKGYETTSFEGYVRGESDARCVPVLLKAVRDDDPSIRRGADLALRRISNRAYGPVDRGTPRELVARTADRWASWWATSVLNPAAPGVPK